MLLVQENEELKRTVAQLQAALQQQQQVSLSHPLTTDMAVQVDLVRLLHLLLAALSLYDSPVNVTLNHSPVCVTCCRWKCHHACLEAG